MKILLDEKLNYYRANLHCHTTLSDGRKTPEQIKKDYMAHGYSIVAYTDHNLFLCHNDLTDKDFVALNALEFDATPTEEQGYFPGTCCHFNAIALSQDTKNYPLYNREHYIWGNAKSYRPQICFDDSLPDFTRAYNPEKIGEMADKCRELGFYTIYNHPTWSVESYPTYSKYVGHFDAMEMRNYGCVVEGYDDDNGHCYDDMLHLGDKLACVATDDNHNKHPDDDPSCDSYGGSIMIGAEALEYSKITDALVKGNFYSLSGNYKERSPLIHSIVVEDREVTIKTEPAMHIYYMPEHRCCVAKNAEIGNPVCEATFHIHHGENYFRFVVIDEKGHKTYTRAYFKEEFEEENEQ